MLALGAVAGMARGGAAQADSAPRARRVTPVDSVDLDRYAGRWHEVARFPNSFQEDCTGETVAEYERLSNGQIRVVNSCRQADGTMKRAEGRARLADRDGPSSKLKVRFAPAFLSFLPMVWGNYWILDLTDDYSAALVGDPGRQYLWVLSRTPIMPDTTYRRMVTAAARQGFDVRRLRRSPVAADSLTPTAPAPE
ncbi:MAG: lipocalin family protein [Gemmatimonadota bacterium]